MASIIRAMAVFQGKSGFAEDQFVNTFHFLGDGTYDEDAILAADHVGKFYENVTDPVQFNAIGGFLSPWIERDYLIKTYDLSIPPIRVPTNWPHTLPAAISANGPPEESAVCLTLHGSVPPASARRRGRLFIGPLCNTGIVQSTTAARSGVSTDIIAALTVAAAGLADRPLLTWVIRSTKPTVNYVPIVGGYVDNALDTQRRRGPDSTSRVAWIASV